MNHNKIESNNTQPNILSAVAFISVFLLPFGISFSADAVVLAILFVISSVSLAWLYTFNGSLLPTACSLFAWLITLFFTRSAFISLTVLIPAVYGFLISIVKKKRLTRSPAMGMASGILSAITIICLLSITYINTGKITLISITEAFPIFFSAVRKILYTSFDITVADTVIPLITAGNVQKYLNLIIGISPGIFCAIFSAVGYFISWLYSSLLKAFTFDPPTAGVWRIKISPVTTTYFTVAIIVFAVSETFNIFTLTASNVALIFFPTFFIAGVTSSLEPIIKDGFIRPRILRPFLLIIAFITDIYAFIIIAIVFAIFDSIKSAIPKPNPDKE